MRIDYRVVDEEGNVVAESLAIERTTVGQLIEINGKAWVVELPAETDAGTGVLRVMAPSRFAEARLRDAFHRFAISGERQMVDPATLPGLSATDRIQAAQHVRDEPGFSGRIVWQDDGSLAIEPEPSMESF